MFDSLKGISEEEILESEIEAVDFDENEKDEYDLREKIKTNNILHSELTSYTNGLQAESVLSSLISGFYVIPKFQRKYVWKKGQVANLALSLIKDVPIPPIYLYVNEKKKHVVLDGQQRVTSLFLYFNNLWYVGNSEYHRLNFKEIDDLNKELVSAEKQLQTLTVEECGSKKAFSAKRKEIKDSIKRISGELRKIGFARSGFYVSDGEEERDISFSSFSDEEKEFLLRKRIDTTIVECRVGNAPKVYAEIFRWLNSGGKLLSAQEIRNGVYWELDLYDGLFEVNKNKQWRDIYGNESEVSKDVEILLKILALNYYTVIDGDEVQIRYDGTFNWSNIMEDYSEISATWNKEEISSQIRLLSNYLDDIKHINRKQQKCNKAVFEAVFVAYTKLNCSGDIEYTWLCGLDKEKEFQKGEVLSNKQSVEKRLTKALAIVKEKYCV